MPTTSKCASRFRRFIFRTLPGLTGFVVFSAALSSAQTPSTQVNASAPRRTSSGPIQAQGAEPAVPPDPLELVTGDAQPVQNAEQRAAVVRRLSSAIAFSNVRAYPYDRRTAFNAFGSTSSDGAWQLEDTSPGGNLYRWTAQGPSYSAINLYVDQMLYSSEPLGAIPLRLAQVRTAIFFTRPVVGPRATLRTFAAEFNGSAVMCILLSHMGAAKGATGGRRWVESEYCIDNASSALITYSVAPGLYTLYDYSRAIHFHDRLIPNKFTITEAGHTVIEAQTVSVSDPSEDASLFQPAGLAQVGVGPLMTPAWNLRTAATSSMVPAGSEDVVIVHGLRSVSGEFTGLELVASSNSALNQSALEMASKWSGSAISEDVEPGATPQSHEVLVTVTFVSGRN